MTKIAQIINTVKAEGCWNGKLSYVTVNELHSKGLYCVASEGGKYKVQDWDNILKTIKEIK